MAIDWDQYVIGPCVSVFGEPASYTPAGGSPVAIYGVFDRAYLDIVPQRDGSQTTTRRPILGVRTAELAGYGITPAQGDTVEVEGIVWQVNDVRDDGHGDIKLMLTEAP